MSKNFIASHFKQMDVSMELTPDLSRISVQFSLEGDYKGMAKVNEKFSEIMHLSDGAADSLIAMGTALAQLDER